MVIVSSSALSLILLRGLTAALKSGLYAESYRGLSARHFFHAVSAASLRQRMVFSYPSQLKRNKRKARQKGEVKQMSGS